MSPTASPRLDRRQLRELLEPVVVEAGYDLEDLVEQRAGTRRLVRAVVDRDGGVSLDAVAEVSHIIAAALDDSAAMGEAPYVLEVTSPGVDRPLTEPRHWRRATGRLVKATLVAGGEVVGRIVAADGAAVTLLVAEVEQSLAYPQIAKARVQVEFNRGAEDDEEPADEAGADEDLADGGDAASTGSGADES
jgi:ribosome maturation factor RimP